MIVPYFFHTAIFHEKKDLKVLYFVGKKYFITVIWGYLEGAGTMTPLSAQATSRNPPLLVTWVEIQTIN